MMSTKNTIKRLKRLVNRRTLKLLLTDRRSFKAVISHQLRNGCGLNAQTLMRRRIAHVASFGTVNAGDTLLPTVLRDLFQQTIGGIKWDPLHVHDEVGEAEMKRLNKCRAVVIGGGGLFLKDTNRNAISGWQWPICQENLEKIKGKIIVFAVGYNRFRGQEEFDDFFVKSLQALVRKSSFVGLRNHGSIQNVSGYLSDDLKSKLSFQPCMTTMLRQIYPERFNGDVSGEEVVALNCAFDRASLRFGGHQEWILEQIAKAMKQIARRHRIAYFSHMASDEKVLQVLQREGVDFELVRLYDKSPLEVVENYKRVKVAIGMRGHAQMIPFGCGKPIVSLISHNKMRWFLEDIRTPECGVELGDGFRAETLVDTVDFVLSNYKDVRNKMLAEGDKFWDVTLANLSCIRASILE